MHICKGMVVSSGLQVDWYVVEDKASLLRSFQVTNQIEACAHARLVASCLALIMLFFPQYIIAVIHLTIHTHTRAQ